MPEITVCLTAKCIHPSDMDISESVQRFSEHLNRNTGREWKLSIEVSNLDVQIIASSGAYRLQTGCLDVVRDFPLSDKFIDDFTSHCIRYMSNISEDFLKDLRGNRA